ncbi:unnamed protein product [Vitrella brassicaformis CCMP3155]|uniref:Uncharacterized protein n=2 Tax=Vitrella brassicaformis TaxID=1169539 RepID=A0A0G4EGD7_VITBC|nr:unnamed protein product [Vitrella brassicaformis CCMP3155]|eukprot:CEL94543.1 unnamed protein product [Vitrella brassicaformis CCMP3155]
MQLLIDGLSRALERITLDDPSSSAVYHYCCEQDDINDEHWGCVYRSLQNALLSLNHSTPRVVVAVPHMRQLMQHMGVLHIYDALRPRHTTAHRRREHGQEPDKEASDGDRDGGCGGDASGQHEEDSDSSSSSTESDRIIRRVASGVSSDNDGPSTPSTRSPGSSPAASVDGDSRDRERRRAGAGAGAGRSRRVRLCAPEGGWKELWIEPATCGKYLTDTYGWKEGKEFRLVLYSQIPRPDGMLRSVPSDYSCHLTGPKDVIAMLTDYFNQHPGTYVIADNGTSGYCIAGVEEEGIRLIDPHVMTASKTSKFMKLRDFFKASVWMMLFLYPADIETSHTKAAQPADPGPCSPPAGEIATPVCPAGTTATLHEAIMATEAQDTLPHMAQEV